MDVLEPLVPAEHELQGYTSLQYQQCKRQLDKQQARVLFNIYHQLAQGYLQEAPLVPQLHSTLQQLEPIAQRHGLLDAANVSTLISEHQQIQQQIDASRQRATELQLIADIEHRQQQYEACVAADEYSKAADCIQSLLEFSRSQEGRSFPDLTSQCREHKHSLQQTLQELVDAAIQSDAPHHHQLVLAPSWLTGARDNPQEVWLALQTLGSVNDVLLSLAGSLCEHALEPLLKLCPGQVSFRADVQHGQSPPSVDVSFGVANGEQASYTVQDATLTCLKVFTEHVFGNNIQLVQQLGNVLWRPLAHAYLEHCMGPTLSGHQQLDSTMLEQQLQIFHIAEQFETDAGQVLCLQPTTESVSRIHESVQHRTDKLMHAKRAEVMDQARQLFFSDDHATAVVGQDVTLSQRVGRKQNGFQSQLAEDTGLDSSANDAMLAYGPFKVTIAARNIVELMTTIMQEAQATGSSAVVQSMSNCLAEIASLFVAVPESRLRQQILQVPQLGCLHFNNCRYVAHEMVSLAYVSSQAVETSSSGNAQPPAAHSNPSQQTQQFLEVAAELNVTGQKYLDQQLERQVQDILGLLENAQGFRQVTNAQRGIAARKVVHQVVHSLQRLGSAFWGVLPGDEHATAAGHVLQAVLQSVIGDLIGMRDISVSESEDLPKILAPLIEDGPQAVLGKPTQQTSAGNSEAQRKQMLQIVKLTAPSIKKLQELLDLMNARLVDIEDRWGSGRLQACGFESHEVLHLIRALFEDTEMRRHVLHYVAST